MNPWRSPKGTGLMGPGGFPTHPFSIRHGKGGGRVGAKGPILQRRKLRPKAPDGLLRL